MTAAGKLVIILSFCLHCASAEADPKDGPMKSTPASNSFNAIHQLQTQKPEVVTYQQLGKYFPQQLYQQELKSQYLQPSSSYQEIPKNVLSPSHHVPVAMVIIAQPAYVPASALQPGNIGQLLQYFRGNSAARFQLLHGNFPHQQQQQQQQYQFTAVSTTAPSQQYYQYHQVPVQHPQAGQYQPIYQNDVSYQNQEQGRSIYHHTEQQQIVPQKLNNARQQQSSPAAFGQKLYPVTVHRPQQVPQQSHEVTYDSPQQNPLREETQTETPYQLNHISQIAQRAAEKFLMSEKGISNSQGASSQQPYRTAPAIFTGFENFSPEQQAKIKEQLSAHFGAPLQPIKVGGSQKGSSESYENSEEKI